MVTSLVYPLASRIARVIMPIAVPRTPSPSGDPIVKRIKLDPSSEDMEAAIERQMSSPVERVRSYVHELDYKDKLVLAPMVRTGTLPMRLLSLYYGAGLVWSPEIVDKAIIGSQREVDPITGVITYHKGQGPIFSTHPVEKPFLVFQVGSSDPQLAAQAAQTVEQDVAGVDLNCGCPKPFSTHAGMGAALLSTPDLLVDILHSLVNAVSVPISCKIRLLPSQSETRLLASRILRTGIRNLTVHCRTRYMRPADKAIWERLSDIVQLGRRRGIPIICNGDGDGWQNRDAILAETGAQSIMLARSAERNPSVFRREGPVCTVNEVIPKLLNICEYTHNPWGNTKFLLNQFRPSPPPISTLTKAEKRDIQERISQSKDVQQLASDLSIELGQGEAFLEDLERILDSRVLGDSETALDVP